MRIPAVLIALTLLSACSSLEFPGVYRLPIDQGNVITQEMVDQLKPGMSRSQVQFIMGTPLLVDTFRDDRWDYLYTLRDRDGHYTRQRLSLFFEGGRLERIIGDWAPGGNDAA